MCRRVQIEIKIDYLGSSKLPVLARLPPPAPEPVPLPRLSHVSPLSYHNKMIGMSPVKWNQRDVKTVASSHWLQVSKAVIPFVSKAQW